MGEQVPAWDLDWCMGMLRHISRNVDWDCFYGGDECPDNVPDYYVNNGEHARWIAAAPALLEACKEILQAWDGGSDKLSGKHVDKLEGIIRLAEGGRT